MRRVLVIGGGAAGLVSLRNLLQLGEFDQVELVERRDDVGGVWYLDDPKSSSGPRWPSPAYPGLVGNVLPKYLSFAGSPFPSPPDPNQPFPTLSETHDYLKAFAAPLSAHIRLNTEVTKVEELVDGWKVQLNDHVQNQIKEEFWDAVVVAVCWYDNPVWPETEGLDLLREKGLAKHANLWRGPAGSEDKRILVLGNANSSNDIAAQLVPVAKTPVYRSIRRPAFFNFVSLPDENIIDVAPVKKYILIDGKVTAILQDGTEITDIDEVQVGTGYRPFPSFVHVIDPATKRLVSLMSSEITPHRIPFLHRLILYSYNPTLAFIGTAAVSFTPFTIGDVTSTWLTLAWTGEIPYPATPEERLRSETERLEAVEKVRSETDNPSSLQVYGTLGAYEEEYAGGLKADIVTARPELDKRLLDWNENSRLERDTMYPLKRQALEYSKNKQTR
ncbi:hypothetical protein C8J56DRAFT_928249 [Mycena floridula]|nr:hypothetical protein C8J56DRAFT_928249 [Mycena floridula]